jgi:hypothetical protein
VLAPFPQRKFGGISKHAKRSNYPLRKEVVPVPKFRIKPEYIIKAKDETAALVKFYKARAQRREDVFLSSVDITQISGTWLKPEDYKSSEDVDEE